MRKIVILSLVLSYQPLFAQIPFELNPVTVTSNRTPQRATETGRNITVLSGKLFDKLPVNSLDELLKYIPGVEVQSRGQMGAQSDITIRGGTFQQVLVLVDGVKLNDPITGHFSSNIPIAPNEIERIEILRGPASAIYGAEAVGGVINVITKTFNRFSKEKSTTADIGLAVGEYGTLKVNGGIQSTGPKMNLVAGILSNTTSGQLLRGDNRGYVYNNTVSGSVSFMLKKNWQLAFRTAYDDRRFAAQNFYTTYISDTATEKVSSWWNQLQLKQQKEKYSNEFDLVYKKTSDHYVYNPKSIANDNKSDYVYFQFLHGCKVNKNITASSGIQFDRRAIMSNDRGNHQTLHGAIFESILYSFHQLKVAPGVRFDLDENYGAAFLPQLNISYQIKAVSLRANTGRAIRSADYTERYNNYNKVLVTGGSIGNPDLKTENSWSYEAGADVLAGKHFKASVTGFYRDQNDVIDWVTTAYSDMPRTVNLIPTGSYALAKNIKKVKTSGIEFELAYQKNFINEQHLYINTGASFLHSITGDTNPSFYILSHAKTLVQTNIIYSISKFDIALDCIYKQREAQNASGINAAITKDYFLMNAKAGYRISKDADCYISCNNITDTHYSDLLGSIMPGRWVSFGIDVKL